MEDRTLMSNIRGEKITNVKDNVIWIAKEKENVGSLSAVREIGGKRGKEIEIGREIEGWTAKRSVKRKGILGTVIVADDQEGILLLNLTSFSNNKFKFS